MVLALGNKETGLVPFMINLKIVNKKFTKIMISDYYWRFSRFL
jgi:hypothetical protein